MKLDYKKLYESRLNEIEGQIKQCVKKKNWNKKTALDKEKKELIDKIKQYS